MKPQEQDLPNHWIPIRLLGFSQMDLSGIQAYAEDYARAALAAQPVAQAQKAWEDDLYAFAGWLTTRPGVMPVGSTCDAAAMANAVNEYITKHSDRFVRIAAPSPEASKPVQAEAPPQLVQAIMAKLANLLDEDQFKDIEDMVVRAGATPPAPCGAVEREVSLGKIARKAFDDYWHEDSKGIENDAWEQSAQAVAAVVRSNIIPPCESCSGTGVGGDAGDDGRTIDVPCGECDGTGRAALYTSPRPEQVAQDGGKKGGA